MHFGTESSGLNSKVVLISSGLNSGTLLSSYVSFLLFFSYRKLKTDLQATRSCTVSWTGTCHHNVNTQRLAEPFNDVLDDQQEILDRHCNNLPPESKYTIWYGTVHRCNLYVLHEL